MLTIIQIINTLVAVFQQLIDVLNGLEMITH